MLTFRVLARLLAYPDASVQTAVPEMRAVLAREALLDERMHAALDAFLTRVADAALLDLQEEYVATFDRGRALSLHLFEHVHGESRDRGQAMADLLDHYHRHGLELAARELPDYLPLLLEFMSTIPLEESREVLADAMDVVVLLAARLRQRASGYAVVFDALEAIGGTPAAAEALRHTAASEGPDQSIVRMDEIWEEEQVTFLANNEPGAEGCGQRANESATHSVSIEQLQSALRERTTRGR